VSATVVQLGDRVGAKARRKRALVPFTVPHFKVYASRLVFDDGSSRDPEDWQLDFAGEVFRGIGAMVRENWLLVPEGNGKTTFVGILGLYGADWAYRPWIPVGASSRDQAKTLYTQCKGFVDDTPGMRRRFECFDGYRSIIPMRDGKKRPGRGIEICPWDPATNDGVIPWPYFIGDELHRHPDMSLWRLWKGKARKRKAVGIGISTAGAPGEEFEEARDRVREQCQRVRKAHGGTLYRSKQFSMWEYRLERPELATDPAEVAKVNPLSTHTVEGFAEELESPTLDMGDFKRLKCNIPARSTFAAITDEEWANMRLVEFDALPEGVHCDAGLDLGWKHDTTALVAEWTNREGGFKLLDEAQLAVPPRDGTALHPDKVKALVIWRHERNPIDTLVMDMSDGADIAAWAADELGITVVDRPQGNDLHVLDYKNFTRDIRATKPQWIDVKNAAGKTIGRVHSLPLRRVRHCPLLTRHSMNAVGRRLPRGDVRFDRPTSSRRDVHKQDTRVIDALSAAGFVHTHTCTPEQRGFDLGAYRVRPL
jgi:phage terminase large subunit-like protein